MPYVSNKDLPPSVAQHLPQKAQTVFRKAFNSAYEEYDDEVVAFKVAWSAVKKQYKKDVDGLWIKK